MMTDSCETCHQCGAELRFVCTRVAEHGVAECYRCTECDAGGHRTQAGNFGPAFETQRRAARVTHGPEIEEVEPDA